MTDERLVDPSAAPGEAYDRALRPQTLSEFVGQEQAKGNLKIFIDAARARGEALDHVLLFGPPGLGKTTLAQIVARELGVGFRATSGPILAKAGDLAAILTNLEPRDVLFIDEIHRLAPTVEEILYPAMEDHVLDLIIGEGPSARSVRSIWRPSPWSARRRARACWPRRCATVSAFRYGWSSTRRRSWCASSWARPARWARRSPRTGAFEIASRSRGTPRVAGRLLRRVRDFAVGRGRGDDHKLVAARALARLEIDEVGLDSNDRRFLKALIENYGGGPVGMDTLAAAIAEARDAVEDVIEPYLLQQGFIQRTPRGRMACARAYSHLGLTEPPKVPPVSGTSNDLFGGK
jgi:Holliday junction DNA helicase RuvB